MAVPRAARISDAFAITLVPLLVAGIRFRLAARLATVNSRTLRHRERPADHRLFIVAKWGGISVPETSPAHFAASSDERREAPGGQSAKLCRAFT
jgi:hypothetical protein